MSLPIGTIMPAAAAVGMTEDFIWTGSEWIKLDSWDGHVLALRLAEMGNDGALNMREYRQQKEGKMTTQPHDVDSFLAEYENLCRKYRISIMPNERTGTFALVDFDEDYVEWVRKAPRFGLGEGK